LALVQLATQRQAELALLRRLTSCTAITGVLVVRVVGEARYDSIEPFPGRGESHNGREYRGVLVEKELHPLQCTETAFCRNLICPFDLIE
jgi:hypothetical protein